MPWVITGALIEILVSGGEYGPTLDALLPHMDAYVESILGFKPTTVHTAQKIYRSDGVKPLIQYLIPELLPTPVAMLVSTLLSGEDALSILDNLLGLLDSGEFSMPIRAILLYGANSTLTTKGRDKLVTVVTRVTSAGGKAGKLGQIQQLLKAVVTTQAYNQMERDIAANAVAVWASDGPQAPPSTTTHTHIHAQPHTQPHTQPLAS